MTLYELTNEFRALTETWDDTITDDEFMEKMTALNQEFGAKIKNCAFFVKNLAADVTAIDAEIKRLDDRRKTTKNKIDRMKDYMKTNMEELKQSGYDFDVISVKLQSNPPSVKIVDDAIIPKKYKVKTVNYSIDKKAIKDAGGCKGAEIVQEKSLRIK